MLSLVLGFKRHVELIKDVDHALSQPKEKRDYIAIAQSITDLVIGALLTVNSFSNAPGLKVMFALRMFPSALKSIAGGSRGLYKELTASQYDFAMMGQRTVEMIFGANRVYLAGNCIKYWDSRYQFSKVIDRVLLSETSLQQVDRKCTEVFNRFKALGNVSTHKLFSIVDGESNQLFQDMDQFLGSRHACEVLEGKDTLEALHDAISQCQTISQNYSSHEFKRLEHAKIGMTSFYGLEQAFKNIDRNVTREAIFNFIFGADNACEKKPDEEGCLVLRNLIQKSASTVADLYHLRGGPREEDRWFKHPQVLWDDLGKTGSSWIFANVDDMSSNFERIAGRIKDLQEELECQKCDLETFDKKCAETFLGKHAALIQENDRSIVEPEVKSDVPLVISYPRYDHNDAFRNGASAFTAMKKQHANVYPAFAGSVDELCTELSLAKEKFGKLPEVLILQGHGSPFSMTLGTKEYLNSGEMFPEGCLEDNLVPNATIVLASCSVGKQNGYGFPSLAKWVAALAPGRRVVAPIKDTWLAFLRYEFKPEINSPEVSFNDGEDFAIVYSSDVKVTESPSTLQYLAKNTLGVIENCVSAIFSKIW